MPCASPAASAPTATTGGTTARCSTSRTPTSAISLSTSREPRMFEAALNISAELIVEWTAYGNSLSREGSRSPWAAPQGVYATDRPERWLVVSVATDAQWAAMVDALGRPDWAADPALASHA